MRRERNKQRQTEAQSIKSMPPEKKLDDNKYKTVYQILKNWKNEERSQDQETDMEDPYNEQQNMRQEKQTKIDIEPTTKEELEEIMPRTNIDWDKDLKSHREILEKELNRRKGEKKDKE